MLNHKLIKAAEWNQVNNNLKSLTTTIANANTFIREIERGNLDVTLDINDNSSELTTSLISMRDQMKQFSIAEQERSWVNEGLARFVEILRSRNNDTLKRLSDSILQNLVTYLKANQGALFLVNDDNKQDTFLEMSACYAYDRKKHLEKRIEVGEGMAGQVVLEKGTLYMTDIPKDFVKITSGLGEALPRHLLVVPLKLEDQVFGVVEIASFQEIKKYQIEFVEKLGESIASTISGVRNADRTKVLLHETQTQAEQMRAQEEEMRQNMEELSATQEGMQRMMKEVETNEYYIKNLLNVTSDSIYTVDKNYKLVTWNKSMAQSLEGFGMRIEKGLSTLEWFPDEQGKQAQIRYYDRAFKGESFEFTSPTEINGNTYHFLSVYAPLRDKDGHIVEVAMFSKDVTAMVTAQQKSERLLQEAQNQAEELKAQEEELRQNMEELSATQEGMQRMMSEVEANEFYIKNLLNVTSDSIYTVDKNYKLVTWNKTMAQSVEGFGMRIEKGITTLDWLPDEQGKQTQKKYYDRAFKGETFEFTSPTEINGNTYHFLSVYAPLRDKDGHIVEAAMFSKDVTAMVTAQQKSERLLQEAQNQAEELKAQEEELRQNMEELSATQEGMQRMMSEVQTQERFVKGVLDSSSDMIVTIDKDYKVINCNKALVDNYSRLGMAVEKGFDITNLLQPEERQRHIEVYTRAFKGESVSLHERYTFEDMEMFINFSFNPIRNEANEIFALSIFAKDVTEITSAKNKIEDSERATLELLNVSGESIMTMDRNYKLLRFNKLFHDSLTVFGVEVKPGFDILSLSTGEQRAARTEAYERAFRGETHEAVDHLNISGIDNYYMVKHAPLFDKQGKISSIAVCSKDITEVTKARKQTEELLNASQQQTEELKAQEEELRQNMEELSATQDGLYQAQQKSEQALEQAHNNEVYLNNMLNATADAILTVDIDLNIVLLNDIMKKTFQDQGVMVDVGFNVTKLAKPGEEQTFLTPYQRAFQGETVDLERSYFEHDYLITYNPLKDADGKIIGASIFTKDVSAQRKLQRKTEALLLESQQQTEELKAQEEELRQNMEELSATQETIFKQNEETNSLKEVLEVRDKVLGLTTILSESDIHGTITFVNDKLCEVSQYSREELIGQPHSIFRHPDMPKDLFKKMWKNLKAGNEFRGIIKNKKKDGTHYWVDATLVPIKDEKGKIVKYVGARYHIEHDALAMQLYKSQFGKQGKTELIG